MCLKHVNYLAINLTDDISIMDNSKINKYSDLLVNDENNSRKQLSNESYNSNYKTNHVREETFCTFCLNKLSLLQIDFDKAIRICSNDECLRYKTDDISSLKIETCTREFTNSTLHQNDFNEFKFDDIIINFAKLANKILDENLERYEMSVDNQTKQETLKPNDVTTLVGNEEFDISAVDDLISPPLIADVTITNDFGFFGESSNQLNGNTVEQQQGPINNIDFDENFFSVMNNFLSNDYDESSNSNMNIQPVSFNVDSNVNLNNIAMDWNQPSTISSQDTNLTTPSPTVDAKNLFLQNETNMESNESCLETLQPTNSSKLAAQLASNVYSTNFLEATNLITENLERNNQLESDDNPPNFEIISNAKTKSGSSRIVIRKKSKGSDSSGNSAATSSDESSTVNKKIELSVMSDQTLTKLKVIDEKDELMALINNRKGTSISNKPSATKKYVSVKEANKILNEVKQLTPTKTSSPSSDNLLPWEKKSKEIIRSTTKKSIGPDEVLKTSPSNRSNIFGLSSTSRTQGSITKADLSQKSKDQNSYLKEKGAVLKQALLNDTSIFASLTKSSPGLLKQNVNTSTNSSGSASSSYKDLVLSVLKKKNSSTSAV